MGISRVSYRGKHFDAPDPVLEVWLRLLVDAVGEVQHVPAWLAQARDEWQTLATEEFGFGAAPDLDGTLSDAWRRRLVHGLAKRALARLESFGDPLTAAQLNALHASKSGSGFPRDQSAELFVRAARDFIGLLED